MAVKTKKDIKQKFISVRGARVHNLKDISVDIPRNKLTVVTGVSGSGKSSLAFDTIYAEGQRRFVESLSSYARQFLERMNKPDCDSISGIPPAIAIEQHVQSRNPRSTVGTTTEIYDYLRLLYGRIGHTICYECGREVSRDTPQMAVNEILKSDEGDKLLIAFPFPQNTTNFQELIELYKEAGYFRFVSLQDYSLMDFDEIKQFNIFDAENTAVLVDRLVLRKDEESKTRLTDSIEASFKISKGHSLVINLSKNLQYKYSSEYACSYCEIVYEEPDPKIFSFNNPQGACPKCQGFGRIIGIDETLVIPDETKSIEQGAIQAFKGDVMSKYQRDLLKIAPKYDIDPNISYCDLSNEAKKIIWEGTDGYIGINSFFEMLAQSPQKMNYRIMISRFRGYTKCNACNGSRIRTSGRQVFIAGKNIPELIDIPLEHLSEFFDSIQLEEYENAIASQLLNELRWRTKLLVDIGLEYITLARLAHTLSGGESQRITLSTALGSALVGTLYVLDEPSIGLHSRDTNRLINILYKIRNLGNTVLVVEHDPEIIQCADHIIDMGPKAGANGGEVIFDGNFDELKKSKTSLTAKYLRGELKVPIPEKKHTKPKQFLTINKARLNNLKIDKLEIPLNRMVVVSGVSGSGKSTLVKEVLYNNLKRNIGSYQYKIGLNDIVTGYQDIKFVEIVDQSSLGKSSRSTPATYTKAFDYIRDYFAHTAVAKRNGWRSGYFSFNVPGGRCDVCEGDGTVTLEMQFLPDVTLLCESCKGTRYKREILEARYKGKTIVDVLDMTIDEAIEFFDDKIVVTNKLRSLQDVGLGYLKLGQPSTMLSGGEAQRIKLAASLDTNISGATLYIFDEPTTGLHLDDISKLIKCFEKLTENGHSVIIIEHNLSVIAAADHIIDLGPEAGERGGYVIAEGTPEEVAKNEDSYTGRALKTYLESL